MSEPGHPARRSFAVVARRGAFPGPGAKTSSPLRGRGPEEGAKMQKDRTGKVTVWVPYPPPVRDGNGAEVVYCVARQVLAAELARKEGLEVVYDAEDGGGVLVGVLGEPERMAGFLRTLAEHGMGRLVVDVEGCPAGAVEDVLQAVAEASAELTYEVVQL